jgi:hypothetical protein
MRGRWLGFMRSDALDREPEWAPVTPRTGVQGPNRIDNRNESEARGTY